ncbi:MAG: hypothetical protein R3B13_18850 [Polyangiaceae bacterium]
MMLLGAVAIAPMWMVACGGDSDDGGGGSSGTGGGLLGGAGGMSGSSGSSGSGGATGGASGSGGGSGGTITNECQPAPSDTPAGGSDGGTVDGGAADAAADAAPSDSGTGGSASDGGPSTIQCGASACSGISVAGLITLNPCCTVDGCGVNIDASVSGLIGIAGGCYGIGQPGAPNATCPSFMASIPGQGPIEIPGCCRPNGECGFAIDLSGFGGPNMGCANQTCNGGPAKTCTP